VAGVTLTWTTTSKATRAAGDGQQDDGRQDDQQTLTRATNSSASKGRGTHPGRKVNKPPPAVSPKPGTVYTAPTPEQESEVKIGKERLLWNPRSN
jgi:hypothetical protein